MNTFKITFITVFLTNDKHVDENFEEKTTYVYKSYHIVITLKGDIHHALNGHKP